jgi:hypothetical protein
MRAFGIRSIAHEAQEHSGKTHFLVAPLRPSQSIVVNLAPLGIPRNHMLITLRDIPLTDWGLRGGQAACDVDLGFDLKV